MADEGEEEAVELEFESTYRVCPRCRSVFRTAFSSCPHDGAALAPLASDPLVGTTLADRYVIEAFVGEGGMGRVYRARHARTPRRFAIKVLFGEMAADPRMRQRFAREAQSASTLDHPNVVPVIDYGDTPAGLTYIAMDFVDGLALSTIIRHEAPMSPARVARLARDVALGLGHAHEKGLVHRDLKPDNIMVVKSAGKEVPRLVDFGLAILAEDNRPRLTTGRLFFGTPAYMAPEQARANETADGRADLYALGATMYEMLTGVIPFDGEIPEIMAAAVSAPRPRMTGRRQGLKVPEPLEVLVRELMAPDREDRPPSAAEVATRLEAMLPSLPSEEDPALAKHATVPVAAPLSPAPPAPAPRDARKHRQRTWWIVGGVAVLAAVLGAVVPIAGKKPRPAQAMDTGPDAAASAPAPPDAATVVAELPAADAAPAVVAVGPADAGSGTGRPGGRPGGRPANPPPAGKPDAGAAVAVKPPPDEPPDPPPGPGTVEAFTQRYRAVGAALEALVREKGKDAAEPLRKKYFEIPFSDAIREPSLRAAAMKTLAGLEKDIKKARQ